MPKAPAKKPTRRPPEPVDDHAVIADWMEQAMPALQPILAYLDRTIRDAIPGLEYGVKWKKAYYGLPGKGWLMEMVAYDVSVNLVFFAGAKFDPAPPRPWARGRATSRSARWTKPALPKCATGSARPRSILAGVEGPRRGSGGG